MSRQGHRLPEGDIRWVSGALRGATCELTAARIWGIIRARAASGLVVVLADKGYHGAAQSCSLPTAGGTSPHVDHRDPLGGGDFDDALVDELLKERVGPSAEDRLKLKMAAENAKRALSFADTTTVVFPDGATRELARTEFEETIKPVLDRYSAFGIELTPWNVGTRYLASLAP